MRFLLPLVLVLLFTACSNQLHRVPPSPESIAGNSNLPDDALIGFYDRKTFDQIRRTPYDAYVILKGLVANDNVFQVTGIKEAYPDDSRNEIALTYAQEIPVYHLNVNSPVRPSAEVYVVFFETHSLPNRALVFSKHDAVAAPISTQGGSKHVKVYNY